MLLLLSAIASGEMKGPGLVGEVDEDLIARMAAGDTEALASLYGLTKSAVYGFALSILKSPSLAEDVMQDTYIKVYQAAGSYTPQGKPMAWILTIARNLALMKLRRRREIPVDIDEQPHIMGESPGFEGESLDRLILHAALQRLSDDERHTVVLHSLSGLKHREIAELLELPLSTVLTRYGRALKKLRKILEEGEGSA